MSNLSQANYMRAVIAAIIGASILGVGAILVRWSETSPQATVFWRFTIALPAHFLWAMALGNKWNPLRGYHDLALIAGLCFALDMAFWHAALYYTSIGNATLFANMAPIPVAIGAWLLWGKRPSVAVFLAMATGLIGASLLLQDNLRIDPGRILGDSWAMIAALCYGGYLLAMSQLRETRSTLDCAFWSCLMAVAVAFIAALVTGELQGDRFLPHSLKGWVILITLGVIVHIGGQGLIVYALGKLPAPVAAVTILVQPILAAILGWWIFEEALGIIGLLGAGLVLAAIWGLHASQSKSSISD